MDEAIQSILAQTCPDWELVVVDDCSPDNLKAIVDRYPDARIRYERNRENLGGQNLVRQWNHSIGFASGEWIVLAADDDMYRPTFCEEVLRLSEKYPQVDLIHSSVEQIDEQGRHLWDDSILPEFQSRYAYLNSWLRGISFTCIGNFAFRRSRLIEKGGFIEFPCAFGSDIATPISLAYKGVANTQEMLFCFRQSDNHLSADTSRFKERWKPFRHCQNGWRPLTGPSRILQKTKRCMRLPIRITYMRNVSTIILIWLYDIFPPGNLLNIFPFAEGPLLRIKP